MRDWLPFVGSVLPAWVCSLVALVPAATALWSGRALRETVQDPAFPERWLAFQQRRAQISGAVVAVLVVCAGTHLLWALPLYWIAATAAAHHIRKPVYNETWTLAGLMAWNLRVLVAIPGFWLLLVFTPLIVLASPYQVATALVLGVVLIAWNHFHPDLIVWILGARPLDRPDLVAPFEAVLARARAGRPRLLHAGPEGGVVPNAFALPSFRRPAVLFLDSLIERLTPDESAAILGHELAHLEYYDQRRLAWLSALVTALIVVAVVVVPGALATGVSPAVAIAAYFLILCAAALKRVAQMQKNETPSDLRAVELCGNAEALVSALRRLHAIAHLPRRWDANVEQRASHPSLARRIQAIRAQATGDLQTSTLESPVIVAGHEAGQLVVFRPEQVSIVWTSAGNSMELDVGELVLGASRVESRRYEELRELRLVPRGAAAADLTFVDRQRTRQSVRLRAADLERVQAVLDTVDQRLAPNDASARDSRGAARLVALLAVMLGAVLGGVSGLLVPVVVVLARPVAASLAAVAAASGGVALLALRQDTSSAWWCSIVLGAVALAAAWLARGWSDGRTSYPEHYDMPTRWRLAAAGALTLSVACTWLLVGFRGRSHLWNLHETVRDNPAPVASVLALAAFLVCSGSKLARWSGRLIALLALVPVLVGSSWFAETVTEDPLIASAPALQERSVRLERLGEMRLADQRHGLALSPSGRYFLARQVPGYDEEGAQAEAPTVVVADFKGWSRTTRGAWLAFVDDERLLRMDVSREGRTTLSIEGVQSGERVPLALDLGRTVGEQLDVRADGSWTILGDEDDAPVRLDGSLTTRDVQRTAWAALGHESEEFVSQQLVDASPFGLAVTMRWRQPTMTAALLFDFGDIGASLMQVHAGALSPLARSGLDVSCVRRTGPLGFHCLAFDGRDTRVWSVDPAAGRLVSRGRLRGSLHGASAGGTDTIVGVRNGTPTIVRPGAGDILHLTWPGQRGCISREVASAGSRVAVLETRNGAGYVTLYGFSAPLAPTQSVRATN